MSRFTHASMVGAVIDIPAALVTSQERFNGAAGRAFVAELPHRAAGFLDRWSLRLDGPSMYGMCALVLPVLRADGTRAALKLQYLDEETVPASRSPCAPGAATAPYDFWSTTTEPAPCSWNASTRPVPSPTNRTPGPRSS